MNTPPAEPKLSREQDPQEDLPAQLSLDDGDAALVPDFVPIAPRVIPYAEYNIHGEVGRGGIGRVLKATEQRLGRQVAVKELMRTDVAAAQRFWRETILTSRLQHPSIIPVYEAGQWTDGTPFYSMRLVSGHDLQAAISEARDLTARLALLPHIIAACEAIAYAHSQQIIHRDLKPQNILVGGFGETVVIDWGLAKELGKPYLEPVNFAPPSIPKDTASSSSSQGTDSFSTQAGAILGTPSYMPPEQARGEEVDTRADVYALGAILYHLLSGEPPYKGRSARSVHRKLLEAPPTPLRELLPVLPSDLVDIVEKAMSREAKDRYPTARELVFDLNKFSTGQLVSAHQYSLSELLVRFYQRHLLVVWVAVLSLTVILASGSFAFSRVVTERDRADAERAKAKRSQGEAELLREQETSRADDLTLLQAQVSFTKDPTASLAWLQSLSESPRLASRARMIAAEALTLGVSRVLVGHSAGTVGHAVFSPDGKWVASAGDDTAVRLWDLSTGEGKLLGHHQDEVWNLDFSPDSKWLISGGKDKTVHLWDLINGQNQTLEGFPSPISGVHFSPDQRYFVATANSGPDLYVYTLPSLARRVFSGHTSRIRRTTLAPDGKQIATSADTAIYLWDPDTGEKTALLGHTGTVIGLKYFADGRRLASAGADKTVRIWNLSTRESVVLTGSSSVLWLLEVSPDGNWLAGISDDLAVHLWDANTGAYTALTGFSQSPHSVRFSPDSRQVASTSDDGVVRLWDIQSQQLQLLRGHTGASVYVDFSPDGRWLLSTGSDATIRLWEARGPAFYSPSACLDAVLSPDGLRLFCLGAEDAVYEWSTQDALRAPLQRRPPGAPWRALGDELSAPDEKFPEGYAPRLALSADGATLAAASASFRVSVWRGDQPEELLTGHSATITALRLSADGRYLATASLDQSVILWDLQQHTSQTLRATARVLSVDFSSDGARLAASDEEGNVYLWGLSGELLMQRKSHEGRVRRVRFSPDGNLLASAGYDHKIVLWDFKRDTTTSLPGFPGEVYALCFSPDGSYLAAAGDSTDAWLWQLPQQKNQQLHGHHESISELRFSADGETLASASRDGLVFLWERAEQFQGRALKRHRGPVSSVLFAEDSQSLLSIGQDKTILRWDNSLPRAWAPLREWLNDELAALLKQPALLLQESR